MFLIKKIKYLISLIIMSNEGKFFVRIKGFIHIIVHSKINIYKL